MDRPASLPRAALEPDASTDPAGLERLPDADARVALGRAALARGDAARALDLAERAEEARPWDLGALSLRADALARLGRAREAEEALSRLAITDPVASR